MNMRLLRSYSSVARAALERVRVGAVVLCAALLLTTALPIAHATTMPTVAPAPLLQFTAGGHVIGFQPTQVVMASLDHALRMEFVGVAGVTPVAAGAGQTLGRAQPPGVVTYPDLWRGIGVEYRASEGGIVKSTYRLAPGADAAQIRLRYNVPVELQSDGSLRFPFARGYISESAPMAWQEIDGTRVPVPVAFTVLPSPERRGAGGEVGFRLGAYDAHYPLTIDQNYFWHTFYGSHLLDHAEDIAVDGSGNVYVTGTSIAAWQGDNNTGPLHAHSGDSDIVVVKLDSAGVYQWHTFYGSPGLDQGKGIAVDESGSVYVTGFSAATWQGAGNASPIHVHSGGWDIVVLKLNNAGAYRWHTFYGSTGVDDDGWGIAVDRSGHVYITGKSGAAWQGDGGTRPLHAYSGGYDMVVLKLNSAGAYQWHTFYGSSYWDESWDIVVDGSGNVYVRGESFAAWQGDNNTNPLHPYSGSYDIVVLKLNSAGAYQWHTFYGSGGWDGERGIAVDESGNVYVTGVSEATWQGDGNASPIHGHSGSWDIFVVKLNSAGAYQWHTFYGSGGRDYGRGIVVDGSGNIYVTGWSSTTWQGDNNTNPLHAHSGDYDIVVLKLNSAGAYQWHTFYGSPRRDVGESIAVDGSGNVYATGRSDAAWQGDGNADPIHPYSDEGDIFVLKLGSTLPPSGSTLYLPLIRRDAP